MAAWAQMTSDIVPLYSFILLSTFLDHKCEAGEGNRRYSMEGVEQEGQGSPLEILP